MAQVENSGGHVDYYTVPVSDPKNSKQLPYMAECQDVIEALNMTFNEGEAFKAIWRRCAERTLGKKKAGNEAKRDAQKVVYYGGRMLAQDEQAMRRASCIKDPRELYLEG